MHLFSKYSLFFKNEIGPLTQIPQNSEIEKSLNEVHTGPKVESIYGQLWNLQTDCLLPNIEVTVHSKSRGMKIKAGIIETVPEFKDISRKSLAVLTACITSVDGVLTVMIGAGAKLLLSRACQVCPVGKAYYNEPIYKYDKNLS